MKPTVFMTNEEVEEAVKYGYLNNDFGYRTDEKSLNTAPTIFAELNGRVVHQPNNGGIWSDEVFIKWLQKSVMWSDIREQYTVKMEK